MPATARHQPTLDACNALLGTMPAVGAFRRSVYHAAPPESRGWLGALGIVARHPDGIRPSQLADLLFVDLSVASRNLTQLEELGYAARQPDPDDGRATRYHVTDAGRDWVARLAAELAQRLQLALDGWSDQDVRTLTALLNRLGSHLDALTGGTDD